MRICYNYTALLHISTHCVCSHSSHSYLKFVGTRMFDYFWRDCTLAGWLAGCLLLQPYKKREANELCANEMPVAFGRDSAAATLIPLSLAHLSPSTPPTLHGPSPVPPQPQLPLAVCLPLPTACRLAPPLSCHERVYRAAVTYNQICRPPDRPPPLQYYKWLSPCPSSRCSCQKTTIKFYNFLQREKVKLEAKILL